MNQTSSLQVRSRVYVVDDDAAVRTSLADLLGASGLGADSFVDAQDFLGKLESLEPGVLLVDMRLGGTSGLDLLAELAHRDCLWPAAIITGHGDIPLTVEAMRLGAFDFLEKPFTSAALHRVVERGLQLLQEAAARSERRRSSRQLIETLSPRQRQVFEGVVEGLTNKEIALRHGLSHRTVETYRLGMTNKLGMQNRADLFELKAILADLNSGR